MRDMRFILSPVVKSIWTAIAQVNDTDQQTDRLTDQLSVYPFIGLSLIFTIKNNAGHAIMSAMPRILHC